VTNTRDCPARIEGLHTLGGGHVFSDGVSFPIERDEPLYTPEQAEGWSIPTLVITAVFAIACLAAVFYGVQYLIT
jgi:hypothetical protein